MMCYTDGVTEAANAAGEQFGEERLHALMDSLLRSIDARDIAERLLAELSAFLGDVEPQESVTLLVLRALEHQPAEGDG